MAQRSHSGEQSAQPGSLPAAPSSSQGETQNLSSSTFRSRVSNQDSQSCPQTRRVSIQEPLPIVHSRRVSIQDSQPSTPTRRVSIQEPLPILYSRRVSIQEPLPIVHSRRVSIQDSQSSTPTRRVSIQEPLPIVHSRRVSIQDSQSSTPTRRVSIQDSQSSTPTRRVSIQEPLPIVHSRRVSIQDSQSSTPSRRVSIQDPLSINSQRLSIEDTTPVIGSHQASIQDPLSVTYSRQFHTRDAPPVFQSRFFSNQNPLLTTRTPLTNIKSVTYHSQLSVQSPQLSLQSSTSPVRARVDVPLSITHSPEASIKSVESIVWTSQETIRDSSTSSQISQSILENNTQNLPSASFENSAGRCLDKYRLSHSQLPMGWWLLHEAKRISRQLNLLLSLASIVIIGLISLGQPWIHFQVPLALPGDPGFRTISIDTILFIRCPDVACMHEDQHDPGYPVLPDAGPGIPAGRHDLQTGVQLLPGMDRSLLLCDDWSLFLFELHKFLVPPGKPGHLDLRSGGVPRLLCSRGSLPSNLPALLSSPQPPPRVLPFFQSPLKFLQLRLMMCIFK
ncbi:serine-rich adhesin for platelets-like isoform X3 [Odocoileus virginianus]|uniref:Serine-rich adhesin for platelets-like isoform X3 n=1 Tax=Odocoileus virginianus TaxID=9874 RepID=A0ABM4GT73_ODOVR